MIYAFVYIIFISRHKGKLKKRQKTAINAIYNFHNTALSFKNSVDIQKRCYFIAGIRTFLPFGFYAL